MQRVQYTDYTRLCITLFLIVSYTVSWSIVWLQLMKNVYFILSGYNISEIRFWERERERERERGRRYTFMMQSVLVEPLRR